MESFDTLLLTRMAERLLGLLAGVLCVVLGYRLFVRLPEKTDSAGKVVLPGGISIWMSRVGPGCFFALFGAAIVAYSFTSAVKVSDERQVPSGRPAIEGQGEAMALRKQEISAMSDRSGRSGKSATSEEGLIELRTALANLNAAIDRLQRDAASPERERLVAGLQNAKTMLLRAAWNQAWGDPARFQSWINSGAILPAPSGMDEPAGLYLAGQTR